MIIPIPAPRAIPPVVLRLRCLFPFCVWSIESSSFSPKSLTPFTHSPIHPKCNRPNFSSLEPGGPQKYFKLFADIKIVSEAGIFSVASLGGFALWMGTTFRTPIDTRKVIVPYLLTIIFFIVHVYEEYLTDFEVAITDITGFHMLEKNFLTVAAFFAPVLWITGAILIIKKTHVGFYFLSFFYVAMMFAELSHYIFPFLEDGTFHYVSGMYTAAIPLIPAVYGLWVTLTEIKKVKRLALET